MLEGAGYAVVEAEDGMVALEQFSWRSPIWWCSTW